MPTGEILRGPTKRGLIDSRLTFTCASPKAIARSPKLNPSASALLTETARRKKLLKECGLKSSRP